MVGDYVSKAAAINKIMENIVHQDSHDVNLHNIGLRKAMSAIDSLPAADVVEVVRCYECKYWEHRPDRQYDLCAYFIGAKRSCTPEDFCSCGERKDGGPDA